MISDRLLLLFILIISGIHISCASSREIDSSVSCVPHISKKQNIDNNGEMETCHSGDTPYIWHNTEKNVCAVALVVHGLNTKPEKMDAIIDILLTNGIRVLQVQLKGHRGIEGEIKKVSRDIWLGEMAKGFEYVHIYAGIKKIPVLFAGFSLGCAVGIDTTCSQQKQLFDYALYFAPAITLRWYTYCVIPCYIFGNNFMLSSRAPSEYTANKGTSIAAYKSLFKHVQEIKKRDCKYANVPSLCFIDPQDELVNSNSFLRFIEKKHWSDCDLIFIKGKNNKAQQSYHHLIIDPDTAGMDTWNTITVRINQFIDQYIKNKK